MAWKSIWNRPLVSLLTLLSISLGVGLVAAVLTLRRETDRTFLREQSTFDLVVGAKGSPLQLVLSTLYHLDVPNGNIAWSDYETLKQDPRIRSAVPIGVGDNYRGFRIIGTLPDFFDLQRRVSRKQGGEKKKGYAALFTMKEGRLFQQDFEVVLGARAASEAGLSLGDTFYGSHGLVAIPGSGDHRAFPYTVVGILNPSGTAQDQAILTPLASVWKVHDKEAAAHRETVPEDMSQREVTAVLVQLKAVGMRIWIKNEIQKSTDAMAAIPIDQMHRMYQRVIRPVQQSLLIVAGLVVVTATLTILTTLYQSAERRRRDMAVMRALGARPIEILLLILLEALVLTLLGIGLGWVLGHGGIALMSETFQSAFGVKPLAWATDGAEGRALGIILLAGLCAGIVPALFSYARSPVRDLNRVD
jgi:putative ABC transport system permease protein